MKKLLILTFVLTACGPIGPAGQNGTNGSSCTVTSITSPQAGSLITCTDGTSSLVLNGTVVTPVQFCSGYTTIYPSSFPEFGFLINGSIYAVYWDGKNAWLAQVVPGYYASTSTSAPCNFTVNSNGTITQD
jgi:hypothetical protein